MNSTEDFSEVALNARKFAEEELKPGAAERDLSREFPQEQLRKMGSLGWMGVLIPEEWGGAGGNHSMLSFIAEEIAAQDFSCSTLMASHNTLVGPLLLNFGTERIRKEFLRPAAKGELLGAFALTEAQSGSDAFNLKSNASRTGADYVITGMKQFVTAGAAADFTLVFTLDGNSPAKSKTIAAFVVPTSSPGYRVVRVENTFGLRSAGTCEIALEGVKVSREFRIGEGTDAREFIASVLLSSRAILAAQAVGLAREALRSALSYAKERVTFGKPIFAHQVIASRLADMATAIEAAHLLTNEACRCLDRGKPAAKIASMAKLYASETAEEVARKGMEILGGVGYSGDCSMERLYRDARVCSIYEGTSDIQRLIISNELAKL